MKINKNRKQQMSKGMYCVNCPVCKKTCQIGYWLSVGWSNVMSKGICSKCNCEQKKHKGENKIWNIKATPVTKTNYELQDKYKHLSTEKTVAELVLADKCVQYAKQKAIVVECANTLHECITFLNENALKPCNYTIEQIYDKLIQNEEKGFQHRIEVLRNLKENKRDDCFAQIDAEIVNAVPGCCQWAIKFIHASNYNKARGTSN